MEITWIWWAMLSTIQIFNIHKAWNELEKINKPNRKRSALLCFIYTTVCAYRAFLPRQDVEKVCLFDNPLSSVFLGRSFATIAEICFIEQIKLFYRTNWKLSNMYNITIPIFIAEICSWMGVITTNELWNTTEETLWAITFIYIQICNIKIVTMHKYNKINIIMSIIVINTFYITGMVYIDIPNYFINWLTKKHTYLSIPEGLQSTIRCKSVTDDFNLWLPHIIWMTPYFTAAVWFSILMTRLQIN